MSAVVQKVLQLARSDAGPTATEYGVLLGLIAVGVLSAMSMFGEHMNALYVTLAGTLSVF